MPGETYDVVLLGGGTGGYVAAIRGAQLGLKVAVVEKDKVGGTCVHRGCIPTKALLKSGSVVRLFHDSADFGVTASGIDVNYGQASKRSARIVDQNYKGILFLFRKHNITVIEGTGRLKDNRTVAVAKTDGSSEDVTGKAIIIDTGSRPRPIKGISFDGKRVINSDHATTMDWKPERVIVRGGGATGVEFSTIWRDFGCQVTLVGRVVPNEDAEVAQVLTRSFSRSGIKLVPNYRPTAEDFDVTEGGVRLRVHGDGKEEVVEADTLMVATGRQGNIEDIGLEELGIKTERSYIVTDDYGRTGIDGVWAIGDVIGKQQLAHTAMHQGIIVMEMLAGENPMPLDLNRVPNVTFCHPEIGSIGLTEQEATDAGHKIKVGKFPLTANGKARIEGEGEGFAKMIADADTNDILGFHMIGGPATELIGEAALAKLLEATPWEIGLNVQPHPTISEVITEAALAVDGMQIHI
ncbi:MAG TPA: dihydrolipoyl dehydrogenase [Thermomicrobiaceae bacterium]|nr:dihydrolipoyl dehydrogenase [Thermomicrobiaceae bacterium]